ncbi:MAG: CBS domain-containing protein [Rhodospirillales bacterium]|nr:CBS domain-containing protein [Rhodospirillales bacterium]
MNVRSILKSKGSNVVSVDAQETVSAAAQLLANHRIGALVVGNESGDIVGIFSERDIVAGIAKHGASVLAQPVSDLMTRDVVFCKPSETLVEVMGKMTDRRVRHLPVVDGDRVLGVVSIGDVVKQRIAETEHEAEALREYIVTG